MDKRRRKRILGRNVVLQEAFECLSTLDINSYVDWKNDVECSQPCAEGKLIDWNSLPTAVDPFQGSELTKLTSERAQRKRQQLESIIYFTNTLIKPGDTVCDFGCGAGHIGLLIGYLFPGTRIFLVEHNPEKQEMVRSRVAALAKAGVMCNVEIFNTITDLENSKKSFQIGVSLHSCGLLTDETLAYCVRKQASYVLVPCCYGQIKVAGKSRVTESQRFSQFPENFLASIIGGADFTVKGGNWNFEQNDNFNLAKRCMCIIDSNRQAWASEHGYRTELHSLIPLNCSPKNNLLLGYYQL
jgi:hypothetical protein